ncbi:hypothetical protein J7K18_03020 [bacterium]|nr:hypothetical protein [bacterium]
MARKVTSFRDKLKKAAKEKHIKCPVCGREKKFVKAIRARRTQKGSYRYVEEVVAVCGCNEKDVFA